MRLDAASKTLDRSKQHLSLVAPRCSGSNTCDAARDIHYCLSFAYIDGHALVHDEIPSPRGDHQAG